MSLDSNDHSEIDEENILQHFTRQDQSSEHIQKLVHLALETNFDPNVSIFIRGFL